MTMAHGLTDTLSPPPKARPLATRGVLAIGLGQAAERFGIDPGVLFDQIGLPRSALSDPGARVPVAAIAQGFETLARRTGRDDVALAAAAAIDATLGSPGAPALRLAVRAQPTLGGAVHLFCRHEALQSLAEWHRAEDAADGAVVWMRGSRIADSPGAGYLVELSQALTVFFLRGMLGPAWRPRLTRLTRPAPRDAAPFEALFGAVAFGQPADALVLSRADACYPFPDAEPAAIERIERSMAHYAASSASTSIEDVESLVIRLLIDGDCTLQRLAEAQGVERRTAHRRLQAHGASFTGLVDRARREIIDGLMGRDDRPVADFASLLGFSSLSTFSRWFGAAYGVKASEYSRRRAGATEAERSLALFGATEDLVFGLSPVGSIQFANEAVTGLGHARHELAGQNIRTLLHPEDRALPTALERWPASETEPTPERFGRCRLAVAGGGYVWCDYALTAIRNAGGHLREVLAVLRPLGERQGLEEAAQVAAAGLRATATAVLVLEPDGAIAAAHGGTEAVFRAAPAVLAGLPFTDLIHESGRDLARARLAEAAETALDQAPPVRLAGLALDGGLVDLQVRLGWIDLGDDRRALSAACRLCVPSSKDGR